jgi:hypothetical protein
MGCFLRRASIRIDGFLRFKDGWSPLAGLVSQLPKGEHDAPEWQAVMEALLLVVEHGGPTMLARIGVMRALNRHVVPVFGSSGKKTHWAKRKLARDR